MQTTDDLDEALDQIARIRRLIADLKARGLKHSAKAEHWLAAAEQLMAEMVDPPTRH